MAVCAGQIRGPFEADEELVTKIRENESAALQTIDKIGISCPVKTLLVLNGGEVEIGNTGIFELDEVEVRTLSFKTAQDGAVFITYQATFAS